MVTFLRADEPEEFEKFEKQWKKETLLTGMFGLDQDFAACIDDPEFGVGNPAFDAYADEINLFLWGL